MVMIMMMMMIKELHSHLWLCALLTGADGGAVSDHIWAQPLLLHAIKE